jgi:hypothetical protein
MVFGIQNILYSLDEAIDILLLWNHTQSVLQHLEWDTKRNLSDNQGQKQICSKKKRLFYFVYWKKHANFITKTSCHFFSRNNKICLYIIEKDTEKQLCANQIHIIQKWKTKPKVVLRVI